MKLTELAAKQSRIADLERQLAELVSVAESHGWNVVENSKILSVFLEDQFEQLAESRRDIERLKVYAETAVNLDPKLIAQIDSLTADREEWKRKAEAAETNADFHRFWEEQAAWSRETFGQDNERGPTGPLKHLEKEAREAYTEDDPDLRQMEIVDCLFLTFDSARRAGMTIRTLGRMAFAKLEINKERKWNRPTSDEPVEHVRDAAIADKGE